MFVIFYPDNVNFDPYGFFNARRDKYFFGLGSVDRWTKGWSASVAWSHSLIIGTIFM